MRRGRRSEVNVLPSDCGVIVEPERLAVLVQGGVGYDASTGGLIVEVLSLYWRDVGGMNYLDWTEHPQHHHRRKRCEQADDRMAHLQPGDRLYCLRVSHYAPSHATSSTKLLRSKKGSAIRHQMQVPHHRTCGVSK